MSRKILFIIALVLVVFGAAGFLHWRGSLFSKEVLRLEIIGPKETKVGEEITYTVKYKNNGNFALQNPKLIFELPEHSLTEGSEVRFVQEVDDIYPGDERLVKFTTRLLGKENELKVAKASLSYAPKNLSARYESSASTATRISSVPLNLTFDLPSRVEKGKEVQYSVNYFSHIDYPLEHMSVTIGPVQGFEIGSSDPLSLDNYEWRIETLAKSQGGKITIRGNVLAEPGGTLRFFATIGMWRDGVFVVIKEVEKEVEVIEPLLFVSQLVNGQVDYIASPGETLRYELLFKNIGSSPFDDLFIISRLEGSAFDLSTLRASQGQVRVNDNLIVFDSRQAPQLRQLRPGQEARVDFTVTLKKSSEIVGVGGDNVVIKNRVNVFDITEEFTNKVSSKLEVSQKGYYSERAGIKNSGLVPPRVGETTTYIIAWQVKNYVGDVRNVKVRAKLPPGIGLVDQMVPESEALRFSFDSASREIIWFVGDLSSGRDAPILYFQVALTPTASHRGNVAQLVGQATVSGEDLFTNQTIQSAALAVTTALPDDAGSSGGGVVR